MAEDIYERFSAELDDDEDLPENAQDAAFMRGWVAADPFS